MDGSAAEGWEAELGRWLEPFLGRLRRKEQRRWAPFYVKVLILPGERKSVEPMAARVAPGDLQQLHHFVSTSPWATAPLEDELVKAADRLVGGPDAVLVVDDTGLVKQGRASGGGQRASRGRAGQGRRPAGRRAGCGPGRGRHGPGEAGPTLGRCQAPVLRPARQAGQLPVPGLPGTRPGRGAGMRRPAAVPAGGLVRGRRTARGGGGA